MFIRPEDVELIYSKGQDVLIDKSRLNHLAVNGKVLHCFYQGQKYRYFVETSDYETPIEVTHSEKIEPGERVQLIIPSPKCRELHFSEKR
jgi:hypothetical protein